MLVVTARIFKDNQLIGYRLSDGQSSQDLTKQQAWVYAKNKQIMDVIAVGTENDPGLSGINGFELKYLPQVQWQELANNKYDTQDLLAAFIDRICNSNATVLKEIQDVSSRDEYKQRIRDSQKRALKERVENCGLKEHRAWVNDATIDNALYVGGHVVGYTVRNISNYSIGVYKMPIGQERRKQLVDLNAGKSIELSRAEMALTLSQQQFSGKIGNCKLVSPSMTNKRIGIYEWLSEYYIASMDGNIPAKNLKVNEHTKTYIVNEDMISKFADGRTIGVDLLENLADAADKAEMDGSNIRNAANSIKNAQSQHVSNTMHKLKTVKNTKGLFDAFKR